MKIIINPEDSNLTRHVIEWLNSKAEDYPGRGVEDVLKDLFHGGCQSGYVGHLIYYTDTEKFYEEHQKEIDSMLKEICSELDCGPHQLFREKWDTDDPLARDIYNKNLLAWFGFEETARLLEDRAVDESNIINPMEHNNV